MGVQVVFNGTYDISLDELLTVANFQRAKRELEAIRYERDRLSILVESLQAGVTK